MALGDEARLLSNDVLARWLIEDFPYRIQLAQVFPFLPVAGDRLRYTTTASLAPAVPIGDDDDIPDATSRPQDGNRTHAMAELATEFWVSYRAQDVFSSNANDQVEVQTALAVRKLLYRFWTLFESGDAAANPAEFDGLAALIDPGQAVDLAGEPLRLEDLERALELVRVRDGRCRTIYASSLGKRAIHAAYWTRGLAPDYQEISICCSDGSHKRARVLAFDGAPVYVNDLNQVFDADGAIVPPAEVAARDGRDSSLSSHIWCFALGEGGLHGITPASSTSIIVRQTIEAGASRLVHQLTMPVGVALGSASALAAVRNASIPGG